MEKMQVDVGYSLILKAAASLGKGGTDIEKADKAYLSILKGQDAMTRNRPGFQQLAALSVIETELKSGCLSA